MSVEELVHNGFTHEQTYAKQYGMALSFVSMYNGVRADFKAYITGFTDNFNSGWVSEQPYGKSDPIRHFSSTERSMSVSWQTIAKDKEEAIANIMKISALAQMMYPVYENRGYGPSSDILGSFGSQDPNDVNNLLYDQSVGAAAADRRWCISAPPLMTVKLSNLIRSGIPDSVSGYPNDAIISKKFFNDTKIEGLICAVESYGINPRLDAGFFEDEEEGILYPKVYDLSCVMSIFHQASPSILVGADDSWTRAYGNTYGVGFANKDGSDGGTNDDEL